MGALIVHLALSLLLCILGLVIFLGKGSFLIAGYNTASPREKAKYDERALCRAVGTLLFCCAACFLVPGIGVYFDLPILIWGGIILMLVVIIAGAIFINTSKRLKRK